MRFDRRFWVDVGAGVPHGVWWRLPSWLQRCFSPRRATAVNPQAPLGLVADPAHPPAHDLEHGLTHQQAQALVRAVDAGGLPLHPGRVNQIARRLGLQVSSAAPVGETVARIRAALARLG